MHWHPREHRKALEGMQALTLEERGAYNTCLDLIYDREGPIPDDPRWLAGWMGVSVRRWNQLRASLIVKGKLYAVNLNGVDCLMNERAARELGNQAKLARKLSESGAKGGNKSAERRKKANENNASVQAPLEASLKLITKTDTDTSVVPSNEETTDGEPSHEDPNQAAWRLAVLVLRSQGGLSDRQARAFFGRLVSAHGLEARDLLGALGEAVANQTGDPQAYLTKAAFGRARRKGGAAPQKRVAFV